MTVIWMAGVTLNFPADAEFRQLCQVAMGLSREQLRNSDLESRIEGLELALELLERKKVHENDIQSVLDASDGYGGMLEVARKFLLLASRGLKTFKLNTLL
ncbi:hypothetical protein BYT27DRAFT_7334122 [Phlegmacium glaucopus]|nr:hypothetical protein BYT27DRAFT_7334122 [Phlegmacium glaucopus]